MRNGLVIGSFALDLDFVPLVVVYLFDPTLARSFHRSASHSLLIPMLVLAVSMVLYLATHKQAIKGWGMGIAIGLASHVVLDTVFWFTQVNVLWPLDLWGISSTVDMWRGYVPPTLVYLLINPASEFLCYGLLYGFLRRRALRLQTGAGVVPTLRKLERSLLVIFGVYVALAFLLPSSIYEILVYGATTFVFAPLSLYLLWRLRRTIVGVPS